MKSYFIMTPLNIQTQFTFVNVFRESTRYCRIYNLPFISLCVCTRESAAEPSSSVNLTTGEAYTFHENDICLTLPGASRRYTYTPANEHLCIHFLLELFPGANVFAEDGSRRVVNSPELRWECEAIFHESDPILRLAGCQEFALKICRMYWPEDYAPQLEGKRFFEPVLRHIRSHVSAEMRIADLAERLGCSEDLFSRRFHAVFGETPKKHLQKELFSRASQLLANPEMSVKTTAALLGFSSEFYFSKFFKRLSSFSPSEYQKQSGNLLNPEK